MYVCIKKGIFILFIDLTVYLFIYLLLDVPRHVFFIFLIQILKSSSFDFNFLPISK